MDIDACFQVGYVAGTHGLSGELNVVLDVDQPENYYQLESAFLCFKGQEVLIPFFISYLKPQGNKIIVKFEDVPSLQEARLLVGSTIHLPLERLPKLEGSSFYFHEIINCKVKDSNAGVLGSVAAVYDQTPQVLIGMEYQGREVLIPYNDDIVKGLDRQRQQLLVTLPQGLLQVYLED